MGQITGLQIPLSAESSVQNFSGRSSDANKYTINKTATMPTRMFSIVSKPFAPVGVSDCDSEERDGHYGEDKIEHVITSMAELGDGEL
jgi:hypothetical protein